MPAVRSSARIRDHRETYVLLANLLELLGAQCVCLNGRGEMGWTANFMVAEEETFSFYDVEFPINREQWRANDERTQ